jgi:hypothetical protein
MPKIVLVPSVAPSTPGLERSPNLEKRPRPGAVGSSYSRKWEAASVGGPAMKSTQPADVSRRPSWVTQLVPTVLAGILFGLDQLPKAKELDVDAILSEVSSPLPPLAVETN